MHFKIGDYIKFYKPKNASIYYGKIIDIVGKHYKFVILGANRPNLKDKIKYFLIDGPISKHIYKIKKEDVKEGFVREDI